MKKKILILEDEKDVAELYAKRLIATGYETTIANNGLEGLEKLKNLTPDLILLDINMPQMGGLEFYQRICGKGDKPPFPVLVLTARTDLEALFRDFNVDGFINKPFDGSRLLSEVEVILKKQFKRKQDGTQTAIVIVDDDLAALEKISKELSGSGYHVEQAESAVMGIERIMNSPPDLALIKLGLKDLSGDMVALRLQNMAKTKHVPFVLYAPRSAYDYDRKVFAGISSKTGIKRLCEYDRPEDLLNVCIEVLVQVEKENKED